MGEEQFDFIKIMSNATHDMMFLCMLLDALEEKELYPVIGVHRPEYERKGNVMTVKEKFKIDLYTKEEMIENEMDVEAYKMRLNDYLRTVNIIE